MLMLSCFSCISLRKAAEVMSRENHPLQQSVSRAAPACALCCTGTGAQLGIHLPLMLRLSALSDGAHNQYVACDVVN